MGWSFNSTLVQLKEGDSEHLHKKINRFNSTLVQLKVEQAAQFCKDHSEFQFYLSSIKSFTVFEALTNIFGVSILP